MIPMKRILGLLLALLAGAWSANAAMFQVPIAATGSGGSVTGTYSFAYPLSLSGTSVTLRAEISSLTNFSAGISNVVYLNGSSNVVSALSNVVSGTRYVLAKGAEWQVRGDSVKSNGLAAINIFNKSNVEIVGYGATIYATNIGDVLYLTNCQNVQIEGLTLKGTVVTNYVALGPIGVVWGALGYFACNDLRLYHNRMIDHHDHGVLDYASQGGNWKPATTNIQGRFNFFYNGGSMRTNESSVKDGTAIVPTGGDWTDNTIMYWMRGFEPYVENLGGSATVQNTLIARNRIVNSMDDAILTAGSTNAHGLIIEDNVIEWHPGATWRGSNFIVSATGININAGQRVKILRNKIYYAPNFDIDVPGNLEKFGFVIEDNFGYGYFYGASGGGGLEVTSSSARMPNRGFSIKNNKFEFKRGFGIGLTGVRDSEISGNKLINTGLDSTRQMWIYSDATTICSNLVIFGNHITSDERDTPTANGIDIENLTLATVLAGNTIYGQATSVNNGAGSQVTQYNFDASSTNRFAAIRDLNVASNALYSAIGGGAQTPWSSDINGAGNDLTNVASIVINGASTVAGYTILSGTNDVPVVTQAAASNSVPVTNIVGLIHRAAAVYIEVDCNREQDIQITNRLAANTIVNWLNAAQGQTYQLRFTGAASGGSDYYVTNTFPSGWLVVNQSTNAAPLAVQLPLLVGDGTGGELNMRAYKHVTGTNLIGALISQYAE